MSSLNRNRKAYHNYEVLETFEAGIVLQGTEVKSCRAANISLNDAYARVDQEEAWLYNAHIGLYPYGNMNNHEPMRPRKLLLHRREIRKLRTATEQKGLALIPLSFYLKRGRIKVGLGLCRGKSHGDKRETLKKRQADRDIRRAMKQQ
jgi:SsrA-binding protein